MKPATPAAALVWPMLALIEPIAAGAEPPRPRTVASARSSVASPTAVPVPWPSKSATVAGADARPVTCAPQCELLPGELGPRDAAGRRRTRRPSRARPRARAGRLRCASARRISTTKPQPSPGQKPAELGVVDAHLVGGQRAGLGEADQLERVEAEVDAARERDVGIAADERVAGRGHRQQRRRARAVDGVAAAMQIEVVADAAGDRVGEAAGERLVADRRERPLVLRLDPSSSAPRRSPSSAVGARAASTTRRTYGQRRRIRLRAGELAGQGVAEHDGGRVARQALALRRTPRRRARGAATSSASQCARSAARKRRPGDPEGDPVEVVALDHGDLAAVQAVGRGAIRAQIVLEAQPLGGQAPERAALGQDVLPEAVG